MQTEAQCPASSRYLVADELYSDAALKILQADCVRQHLNQVESDVCKQFIKWNRQANELLVFTLYAYADLAVPHQFDCVFRVANPQEHVLLDYTLTQSILSLGGLHPLKNIEHGHKHLCVLTFKQEVPAIFQQLHREDGSYCAPLTNRERLGFCLVRDLPAITKRLEKITQLRSQYGREWWRYDEFRTYAKGLLD